MGASCRKQRQLPLLPETDTELHDNLVRQQTNKFNHIYKIVGTEPLGNGGISTIWLIRKRDSALGGSSQHDFVKHKRRRSSRESRRNKLTGRDVTGDRAGESPTRAETYYALKEINVDKVDGEHAMKFIRNEVALLKSLDHPGIVRAFETFELDQRLAIVMELCRGGDLSTRRPYSERQAAMIIRQILSAVSYMHKRNCVHKDIKIENVLFETDDRSDFTVKLIDFGLSKTYGDTSSSIPDRTGTIYAIAPETLSEDESNTPGPKVDLFAIGVVTYLLISGDRPFRGKTPAEIMLNILHSDVVFDSQVWKRRSAECKTFITSLLQKDPALRLDAEGALKHPWFELHADALQSLATDDVLESVRDSLKRFSENSSHFKRLALNVVAKQSRSDELHNVRDVFLRIDEGNDGYITMEEFKKAFQGGSASIDYSSDEIEGMFHKLDVNCTGVITYTEFVAGTYEIHGKLDERRLADAFDLLDWDDSGSITKENLRRILGKHYSVDYVEKLVSEVDTDRDGKISFNEFKRAFRDMERHSIEFHASDSLNMDWM